MILKLPLTQMCNYQNNTQFFTRIACRILLSDSFKFTLFIDFLFLWEFTFKKDYITTDLSKYIYPNIFCTFSCFLFYHDDQHSPWECSGGQHEFWMSRNLEIRNLALVIIRTLFLYPEKKPIFIYLLFAIHYFKYLFMCWK